MDKEKVMKKISILNRERVLLEDYKDMSYRMKFYEITLKTKRYLAFCQVGAGVLSKDTAKELGAAIGTRNILIHQYEDVNSEIIYDVIQNRLGLFDSFIDEVSKYLGARS